MQRRSAVTVFCLTAVMAGALGVQSIAAGVPLVGPPHLRHVVPPSPTILPPPGSPPPPVYGFPTTGYRAGWHNTHYWPRKNYHHGFYGDYWQWGVFPGY